MDDCAPINNETYAKPVIALCEPGIVPSLGPGATLSKIMVHFDVNLAG